MTSPEHVVVGAQDNTASAQRRTPEQERTAAREKFVNIEERKLPGNSGWAFSIGERVSDLLEKWNTKRTIKSLDKDVSRSVAASKVHEDATGQLERRRASLTQDKSEVQTKLAGYANPGILASLPGVSWLRDKNQARLHRKISELDTEILKTGLDADESRKKWSEAEVTKRQYEGKRVEAAQNLQKRFTDRITPIDARYKELTERAEKLDGNIIALESSKEQAMNLLALSEKILRSDPNLPKEKIDDLRARIDLANATISKSNAAIQEQTARKLKCEAHMDRLERARAVAKASADIVTQKYSDFFIEQTETSDKNADLWSRLAELISGFNIKRSGSVFVEQWNKLFPQQIDGKPLSFELLAEWYKNGPDGPRELPEAFNSPDAEHTVEEWRVFLSELNNSSPMFRTLLQKNKLRNANEAINQLTFMTT